MFQNKKILAIVPARGGSKGVPLKNIHPLKGRPLIDWTARVIGELSDLIDFACVSTDHPKIAEVARGCGLEVPFMRPESISGDRIGDWDVLSHALEFLESKEKQRFDIVLMLQPTSPLRKASQVREAVEMLVREDLDSVWSVSPTDTKFHPLKQLRIFDGKMDFYLPDGGKIIARQQLTPVFHRNGLVYAISRKCLLEKRSIKGDQAGALIVEDPYANIDTLEDFALAERLIDAISFPSKTR